MISIIDVRDSFVLAAALLGITLVIFGIGFVIVLLLRNPFSVATRDQAQILPGILSALPLGFAGSVAGFLTGSSRQAAVSALVPAILTFIGAIAVYLAGRSRLRSLIGSSAYSFSLHAC